MPPARSKPPCNGGDAAGWRTDVNLRWRRRYSMCARPRHTIVATSAVACSPVRTGAAAGGGGGGGGAAKGSFIYVTRPFFCSHHAQLACLTMWERRHTKRARAHRSTQDTVGQASSQPSIMAEANPSSRRGGAERGRLSGIYGASAAYLAQSDAAAYEKRSRGGLRHILGGLFGNGSAHNVKEPCPATLPAKPKTPTARAPPPLADSSTSWFVAKPKTPTERAPSPLDDSYSWLALREFSAAFDAASYEVGGTEEATKRRPRTEGQAGCVAPLAVPATRVPCPPPPTEDASRPATPLALVGQDCAADGDP